MNMNPRPSIHSSRCFLKRASIPLAWGLVASSGCLRADNSLTDPLQATITATVEREHADSRLPGSSHKSFVAGEIVSLHDQRFGRENAKFGLWHPRQYALTTPPGVYFLEPYDPLRVPVLFIHGIQGSPADFEPLLNSLDRTRFQAWMYSYATGEELSAAEELLREAMRELEQRYHFGQFAVVAHSMGGLVARGFILRQTLDDSVDNVPLFVSISTPWAGHSSAEIAVKYAPIVLDVWRDMAPGSRYLRTLFSSSLPAGTQHFLLFTYKRNRMTFGHSGDRTVALSSQLSAAAQKEAVRLIGYDDTHSAVLNDPAVATQVSDLLDVAFPRRMPHHLSTSDDSHLRR
jgi:pimeloyl-ACP methyl ester carboxylesterase